MSSLVVSKILNKIYDAEATLNDLPKKLEIALNVTPEVAKQMALDYAGWELLPISSYVGDVDSFIRSLGGNPHDYPSERIILKDVLPQDLVAELLHEHPVNVPAHLEHRLREILESQVRGVRKDDETVTRLTRAEKIGGAELPREEAEKIVEALAAKVASVKIVSDNEAITITDNQLPITNNIPITNNPLPITDNQSPTTVNQQPTTNKAGHGIMPEDEHEVNIIREKVLPNMVTSTVSSRDEDIKSALEAVVDATNVALSVAMLERYKSIVTSRLKGVRDSAETRELIMREPSRGGMGFFASDVDAALNAIEKQVKQMNGKREEALKKEKNDFVKRSVDETFNKDESRKKGELEDLDRMYGSLTGKFSKTSAPVAPPPVIPAPVATLPKAPVPIAEKPIAAPPPFVPVAVKSPAPAPVPIAPPAPPLPPLAPPPVAAAPSTKMQDVRPAFVASNSQPTTSNSLSARLTGPVQELSNLTLLDFRRMSADPVEACRKLSDKLDILEDNSYARRIEGIKAWQGSPVYKTYLGVINAAFSGGKPLSEAVTEALAAGRETLTEREVRAIMELNKQLKA